MKLSYIYIDLATKRIFREVPYDPRFSPAQLDGVRGMQIHDFHYDPHVPQAWSKFQGVHRCQEPITAAESQRIQVLNQRCEALEFLYRMIFFQRIPHTGALIFDEQIFNLRLNEAKDFLERRQWNPDGFLANYAQIKRMSPVEAAELMLFLEKARQEALKQSEKTRLEWETQMLTSSDPLKSLEDFKAQIYLGN